jgi:hypothetical protein
MRNKRLMVTKVYQKKHQLQAFKALTLLFGTGAGAPEIGNITITLGRKTNKRPMGHIAHLSNLGSCRNVICISFPFAPFDTRGPMI